jgi:hypothetical protein
VAFWAFDIDQVVKKADAIVMGEEVEFGLASGAGGDISPGRGCDLLLGLRQHSPKLFHVLFKPLETVFYLFKIDILWHPCGSHGAFNVAQTEYKNKTK